MKVMVFVKATADSEAGEMPDIEMFEAMGKYNEELANAGILLSCDGLQPSAKGARVHFSGKDRTVSQGPFKENQLVAGYWLWEVKSLEEAIEWVKRCPNPMMSDSDIDIRPLVEVEDFQGIISQATAEREERLRKKLPTQS